MNNKDLKVIAEALIVTMESAGNKSIKIQNEGLKTTIKKDGSPVTNGDFQTFILNFNRFIPSAFHSRDKTFSYNF